MNLNFEDIILKNLLTNERYFGIVYPHLKSSHFETIENLEIFKLLQKYIKKYNNKPSLKEFILFFKNDGTINEHLKEKIANQIKTIIKEENVNDDFLLKETEKYIQKVELTNAILKSAEILEKEQPFENVIGLVESALSINFDTDTGLHFIDDKDIIERYNYYSNKVIGIPTGIRSIDKALGSGYRNKTLNLTVSPSHGGKTAYLISNTANFILRGKNVLFISLEMTEEEIARRVDANLLDVPANDLGSISKDEFINKMNKLKTNLGKLIIKEYPAGTFNTIKLKALLKELETQEEFNPDIIVIDYVGLMISSRSSMSQAGGMYQYFKLIAEELHGFAKEYDKIILTASQLNRAAYNNLNVGMEHIADSLGIIQTADTVLAILSTEELRKENKTILQFLKNRYTGQLINTMVNVDFSKARFYDMDEELDKISNIEVPSISQVTPMDQISNQNTESIISFE